MRIGRTVRARFAGVSDSDSLSALRLRDVMSTFLSGLSTSRGGGESVSPLQPQNRDVLYTFGHMNVGFLAYRDDICE